MGSTLSQPNTLDATRSVVAPAATLATVPRIQCARPWDQSTVLCIFQGMFTCRALRGVVASAGAMIVSCHYRPPAPEPTNTVRVAMASDVENCTYLGNLVAPYGPPGDWLGGYDLLKLAAVHGATHLVPSEIVTGRERVITGKAYRCPNTDR
ncbi:MAG: hypothetical protein ABTD50_24700 [Polyangiaceae bacterium]|jgi:hypothetical protein